MDATLRKALWGLLRPLMQLLTNLLSPEKGGEWERELKKFLRKEPCWVKSAYELYLAPGQRDGGKLGEQVENGLSRSGLIERAFSLDDELVGGWLNNASIYPEELKGKVVILWKSIRDTGTDRLVACLVWRGMHVMPEWILLGSTFYERHTSLLKPTA